MRLKDKTLFITGASRGIGRAIALAAAKEGANIAIVAKTDTPHPTLPGTIHTVAREIEALGAAALPLSCDIRFEDAVKDAVQKTAAHFGGIDILVNNASAIFLAGTADTPMKKFDLMHAVNVRGTYLCSQCCLPHLKKGTNPHILNLSPPLSLKSKWFKNHTAYTISKFGMSMCVLGMAAEFEREGIAVNALWPRTAIDTAAVRNILGGESMANQSRTPEIMGDAAMEIITSPSDEVTGNFFVDEDLLRAKGRTDFEKYAVVPGANLVQDFFLD